MSADAAQGFFSLACEGVQGLHPYEPGKPISELEREYGIDNAVKLASNENPFGPAPGAVEAARRALDSLALYPDGNAFALKQALAARHGVEPAQVTVGNGSNDILELLARVFLQPGLNAVFSAHAFAVYPIVTQAVGATAKVAPANPPGHVSPYGHDLEAMAQAVDEKTRIVFIANPNNPTGTLLPAAELKAFVSGLPANVVVVIDEAYFEYVRQPDYPDTSRWLQEFPNLVVTRTFSKAYGLAGLRVGYGLACAEISELLNRVRQPFNVNAVAQAAALAALDDQHHIDDCVKKNNAGLAQLAAGFERAGLGYVPSVANFVLVDVGRPGVEVYQRLLPHGVIVRPVANYGLPGYLRVTVGSADENDKFLAALDAVLGDRG